MQDREKHKAAIKRWAERNPEKMREYKRRYIEKHREACAAKRRAVRAANRAKLDEANRRWKEANPEKVSMQRARQRLKSMNASINRTLRYHYAVTLDNYNEVLALQNGVCAICGELNVTKRSPRLVVDHCHASGMLRALLCHRCNCGLGYFKDHLALMRRAVAYLEAFNGERDNGDWAARVGGVLANLPKEGGKGARLENVAATHEGRAMGGASCAADPCSVLAAVGSGNRPDSPRGHMAQSD